MKIHIGWEHPSLKNVDLMSIQSLDPQAWILHSQSSGQSMIYVSKILRSLSKIAHKEYNSC